MSDSMNGRISIGNAEDFGETRGWFVGSFLDEAAGPRMTDQVEVKWSQHPIGDARHEPAEPDGTSTLTILVSGCFELTFPGEDPAGAVLAKQGDFALYGPGVPHSWQALAPSVVMTVRWKPEVRALSRA